MDIHGSPTGLRLKPCQLEVTVKRNAGHGSLQLQSGATHRQRPRDSQRLPETPKTPFLAETISN